jgi:hypothetical protein
MQAIQLIQETIRKPPIPFDPERQSLKNWATYCLRDRGFKIVYAQNADFAIELQGKEKLYCKITEYTGSSGDSLEEDFVWIVRDPMTNQIHVLAPERPA